MKKVSLCLLLLMIFQLTSCSVSKITDSPGPTSKKTEEPIKELFPQSAPVSPDITTFNLDAVNQKGKRLAAISLQGIVNREKPIIYLRLASNNWLLKYYKDKGYVKNEDQEKDLYKLLEKFKNYIKGAVVYDPDKEFTVNTATNIAGIENRIIISPDMTEDVKNIGITDVLDLRENKFKNIYEAYDWEIKNYFGSQGKEALACLYWSRANDYLRDYLIEFKIHTFWLPDPKDPEYDQQHEELVISTLKHTKANMPVLGFTYATTDTGAIRGRGEYYGVKFMGEYGKYTVGTCYDGNYSFNSGIRIPTDILKQTKVRSKKLREYDPEKKYVAFVMIESGDAPWYYQVNFNKYQWDDPVRGTIPMNIGITPQLQYLAPGILQRLYETATENDFFFNSISGLGYMYPLEGYGNSTTDREETIFNYYKSTASQMEAMDIDMLGLYSHPWSAWNLEKDYGIINKYIAPQKNIKSIIADMGRNDGPTVSEPNNILNNNLSVHHTQTRWSKENLGDPGAKAFDQKAAEFLINEIRQNSTKTNFIQAMFLSWQYGPRRLAMVEEKLRNEGYEFVTLNEFDYLYRESKK